MSLDEIIHKLYDIVWKCFNVDILIFYNKNYNLNMCLCVQIMGNRAVTGLEQSESLPPPYPSPPPYTPRPVTCTVNLHATPSSGELNANKFLQLVTFLCLFLDSVWEWC